MRRDPSAFGPFRPAPFAFRDDEERAVRGRLAALERRVRRLVLWRRTLAAAVIAAVAGVAVSATGYYRRAEATALRLEQVAALKAAREVLARP